MNESFIIDKQSLLLNIVEWAKEVGKTQLHYFREENLSVQTKLNESDIVTIADKESEKILINHIHSVYPSHAILSEESGAEMKESDFLWVIDPLDGTTNFSSGLPQFCVSIGVKYKGETILGVVYAPYLNELYTAIAGEGAFLNGKKISARCTKDIHKAVVSTGFPVDKDINPDNNLDNVARVLPLVRGMRRMGAAAVDICSVAGGFLDAYWELNLHEWDVCAGLLIAKEAGAVAVHFRQDRNVSVLVGVPEIVKEILPLLSTQARNKT